MKPVFEDYQAIWALVYKAVQVFIAGWDYCPIRIHVVTFTLIFDRALLMNFSGEP